MEENTGWRHYLRLVLNILIPFMGWVFLCLLGPKLLRFFMPFVIGWIIALIANPPVRFLERRLKLVRKHSSILIVVLVLAMVIGLLYLLFSRTAAGISALFKTLPQLYTALEADVKTNMEEISHLFQFFPPGVQQAWNQLTANIGDALSMLVQKAAPPTMEAAGTVAKSIPGALVYSVVTILSSYFFIVDRDRIIAFWKQLLPEWCTRYYRYLTGEVKHLVGGYFLAQFKIMFVVWLILMVGFFCTGRELRSGAQLFDRLSGLSARVRHRDRAASLGRGQASGGRVRLCGGAASAVCPDTGDPPAGAAQAGGGQYGIKPVIHPDSAVSGL